MGLRRAAALLLLPALAAPALGQPLESAEDLAKHYLDVFKTGNRNAASHLWTKFVLERSKDLAASTLTGVFKGFCPVSGSPLPDDPRTMYKVTLPRVGGGNATGVVRHCCWPCICDVSDLVRVDSKTVATADGPRKFDFLVMGNPCKHPEKLESEFVDPFSMMKVKLSQEAPEVRCEGESLAGAIHSDAGHPIIGMLFTGDEELRAVPSPPVPPRRLSKEGADPTFGYGGMCVMRRRMGYNSGMGLIFHLVAGIAPISGLPALPLPPVPSELEALLAEKAAVVPSVAPLPLPQPRLAVATPAGLALAVGLPLVGLALLAARVRGKAAPGAAQAGGDAEACDLPPTPVE